MTPRLAYERPLLVEGELELSDDRESCRRFLASLLDYAYAEGAEQVRYSPSDGDNCLDITIEGNKIEMLPLPAELRTAYFRFVQEIVRGKIGHFLIRFGGGIFARESCGPLIVEVARRQSEWDVTCTHTFVRFTRLK
jgi:hypothetical protein